MDNATMLQIIEASQKRKKRNKILAAIAGSIFGLGFIALLIIAPAGEKKSSSSSSSSEVGTDYQALKYDAQEFARNIATTHATNPDEVEFENENVSFNHSVYECTGVIISKNDFGVKKRANYLVKLTYNEQRKGFDIIDELVFK